MCKRRCLHGNAPHHPMTVRYAFGNDELVLYRGRGVDDPRARQRNPVSPCCEASAVQKDQVSGLDYADIGNRGTPERRIDALGDREDDLCGVLQRRSAKYCSAWLTATTRGRSCASAAVPESTIIAIARKPFSTRTKFSSRTSARCPRVSRSNNCRDCRYRPLSTNHRNDPRCRAATRAVPSLLKFQASSCRLFSPSSTRMSPC